MVYGVVTGLPLVRYAELEGASRFYRAVKWREVFTYFWQP